MLHKIELGGWAVALVMAAVVVMAVFLPAARSAAVFAVPIGVYAAMCAAVLRRIAQLRLQTPMVTSGSGRGRSRPAAP